MASPKLPVSRDKPALPFDETQEIDPALIELLEYPPEPTLTQVDFEEITVVLPPKSV